MNTLAPARQRSSSSSVLTILLERSQWVVATPWRWTITCPESTFSQGAILLQCIVINTSLILTSSKSRHFVASDRQRYQWRHRYADDQEWAVSFLMLVGAREQWSNPSSQCTNSNGDVVSYYSLKLAGEPPYYSSGCMLTVEEDFSHLACGNGSVSFLQVKEINSFQ